MKKFKNCQRVQVNVGPLEGLSGTVRRLRIADNGAWVSMDTRPSDGSLDAHFPFPMSDDRGQHTMLYPEDCIPEPIST